MAHVAVIGAGFVGLSSAYWLMRDGHQVVLYEPVGAAGGASFGNAGTFANYACIPVNNPSVFRDLPRFLLSPSSPFRMRWRYLPLLAPWLGSFLLHSTRSRYTASATALSVLLSRAQAGYDDMVRDAGLAPFIRHRECLYLYSSAAAFEASQATLDMRRRLGVQSDILGAAEIAALEPSLSPIFERGALFKGSWHLSDPAGFLRALQTYLQSRGLHIEPHAVQSLHPASDHVRVACAAGSSAYDYVALCAGVHSKTLAQQCGDHLPLEAERGYHLMYPGTTRLVSRPVGWAERGFYMTPMDQGIRVAGTVELAGLRLDKRQELLDLLHFASQRALPGLGAPSAPWLGFRPTLPDGLPVLGHSKASTRVVYAFGHQHIGLTLGGLSGSLVADLVAQRAPSLDLSPYAPSRF